MNLYWGCSRVRFKEFNEAENEDKALDDELSKRITDDEAKVEVLKLVILEKMEHIKSLQKGQLEFWGFHRIWYLEHGAKEPSLMPLPYASMDLASMAIKNNPAFLPIRSVNSTINFVNNFGNYVDTAKNVYNAAGFCFNHKDEICSEIYENREEIFDFAARQSGKAAAGIYNYLKNPYNRGQLEGETEVFIAI